MSWEWTHPGEKLGNNTKGYLTTALNEEYGSSSRYNCSRQRRGALHHLSSLGKVSRTGFWITALEIGKEEKAGYYLNVFWILVHFSIPKAIATILFWYLKSLALVWPTKAQLVSHPQHHSSQCILHVVPFTSTKLSWCSSVENNSYDLPFYKLKSTWHKFHQDPS